MSEEEKQAIEYWKTHIEILHCNTQIASEHYIKVLLNLVEKQQKEIEKLKVKNKELFEEYNKRVSTIIDYEQGLKEIIDEEDDPDTWAYHAVKKLLEEVGGIEYE